MNAMTLLEAADRALGHADPTLAYGLAGVADWSTQMPFLDVMKMSRPIWAYASGEWATVQNADLDAGGVLDANGWPTSIPDGMAGLRTVFAWGDALATESRKGLYVLQYEGTGTISVGGAKVVSSKPGELIIDVAATGNWWVDITATDPDGTGDHVRDISIVRQDHLALHEAGAIFNPDWIDLIGDARQLRFMDWMGTNNSTQSEWADRPKADDASWSGDVPVEIMVRLANETGVDPWFTIPHLATDEYIAEFATYVRDHLDPRLKAHVEFSNEAWNWQFRQTHDLLAQEKADWGTGNVNQYYVKKATNMALIWDSVFGDEADARLVKVLAGQAMNTWLTGQLLNVPLWFEHEPEAAILPSEVFDAFAVTTYFGGIEVSDATAVAELQSAIEDPIVDARAWLADRLINDADYKFSLPYIYNVLDQQKALASAANLPLIVYEGGQHILHNSTYTSQMEAFLTDFIRSPEMATVYEEVWERWKATGDGPFMQFVDVSSSSKFGAWGTRESLTDETPRATLLDTLNATETRWWQDDRAESGFQHGVATEGTPDADRLIGTREEDYLLGDPGDDILVGGRGDDGLHGGKGFDRALLSGTASDYTVEDRGDHYLLRGPDGTDWLVDIEELVFEDGSTATPAELASLERMTGTSVANKLMGERVAELIAGDDGHDFIWAKAGDDLVHGGAGDDRQHGAQGDDRLFGGDGDDRIRGGDGDDILAGGAGRNVLRGGEGADLFLASGEDGRQIIHDFDPFEDRILLTMFEAEEVRHVVHEDVRIHVGETALRLVGITSFDEITIDWAYV